MFELPEYVTIVRQMNETLKGKIIKRGVLGNTPHRFVWYNRKPDEFEKLTKGKKIGEAWAKRKWLFIHLNPGYVLLFGECGGKMLYHQPGAKVPKNIICISLLKIALFSQLLLKCVGQWNYTKKGKSKIANM